MQHANLDRRLIITGRRKDVCLRHRHRGVAFDQASEVSTKRSDAKRERRDVEQQNIIFFLCKRRSLNRCTERNHFVRVHTLMRSLPEEFRHGVLHERHPGLATDQHDLIDIGYAEPSILHALFNALERSTDDVVNQAFERFAVELVVEMPRSLGVARNERQVDLRALANRQVALGLLCRVLEALKRHRIHAQINAFVRLEPLH